ncbi:MAG: helicase-associated domain-containing protein [Treponemataceae bacterium]|nr:helicase-associated domain-containing protein [Treponemataceae bacterium]
MKQNELHVQRIIDWRESMATLPDAYFFELMRMYLGEVRTPYNKTKLIEELGAFLRKEENRRTLVSLLSEDDVRLVCAVWFIQNATQEKVAAFFGEEQPFAAVYERLLNLEERLIVYRHDDAASGKTIVSVNPMLEDVLLPFLRRSVLFSPPVVAELETVRGATVSPELLAAYCSFLLVTGDVCKADGSFKKRAATVLESIFLQNVAALHRVTRAFINLSVLKDDTTGFALDGDKLESFAELDELSQCALLCVAASGRFSRSGLVRQAQLLLEVAAGIPESGYTRPLLLRAAFLAAEKDGDISDSAPIGQMSRFSSMLSRSRAVESRGFAGADAAAMVDRLIDDAVLVGILAEKGKTADGEPIFVPGSVLSDDPRPVDPPFPKVLNIDAGFTVTLLPGLPLRALLPLMSFLDVVQFDTAAQFSISKKSVMRAFDAGMSARQVLDLLAAYCPYDVPQNLRVSLDDWSNAYASAALYKGYVLHVSAEHAAAVERNTAVARHIMATLAPGIYVLDVQDDESARAIIAKSRLDFVGKIKTVPQKKEIVRFPTVWFDRPARAEHDDEPFSAVSPESVRARHGDLMRAELEKLRLTPEQKDGLLERIERNIILHPAQLRGDSVRLEQTQAGAMDFFGKVRVIENALGSGSMVALEYENPDDSAGAGIVFVGNPLGMEKHGGDSLVRMEVIPGHEEKLLSVGKARFVRRIRGSVLK